MGNLTPVSFGLILIAITLGSFGQICLKQGLSGAKALLAGSPVQTIANVLHAAANPYVLAGLSLYIISTFFWLIVLSRVRLSVAYPMISIGYILVVILSSLILHERVDWRFAGAGLLFITIGVSFIGFGLGQAGAR